MDCSVCGKHIHTYELRKPDQIEYFRFSPHLKDQSD